MSILRDQEEKKKHIPGGCPLQARRSMQGSIRGRRFPARKNPRLQGGRPGEEAAEAGDPAALRLALLLP